MYYTNLSGTLGFDFLFIFFKFASFFIVVLFFLGSALILSLWPAIAKINSIGFSDTTWVEIYGTDYSIDTITILTKCYFYICMALCYVICLLLLAISIKGIQIGATQHNNRITQFFYTFNCVLLPLLTFILLYRVELSKDTVTDIPIIGDKFLPSFAINSFIALSVVLMALIILGFGSAISESKTALEAYAFILGFVIITLCVGASLLTYYSKVFESYYSINYGDIMI